MKTIVLLMAAAGMGGGGFSQAAPPAPCLHVRTSFDLVVPASYAETAPLFGPKGEGVWVGKHWDPQFVHPQPAHDEEGVVFTLSRGPVSEVWVNTLFDVDGRHYQYVYFMADLLVTTIDIRFKPIDDSNTQVNVVYLRTALTAEGNERVKEMTEGDKVADKEWSRKINAYLAGREQPIR
jgi:hypothetical protein